MGVFSQRSERGACPLVHQVEQHAQPVSGRPTAARAHHGSRRWYVHWRIVDTSTPSISAACRALSRRSGRVPELPHVIDGEDAPACPVAAGILEKMPTCCHVFGRCRGDGHDEEATAGAARASMGGVCN